MAKRLLTLLLAAVLVFTSVPAVASAAADDNLLRNGSFEEYKENDRGYKVPDGWKDKDGIWGLEFHGDMSKEIFGEYYVWPLQEDLEETSIYQDVDISDYSTGAWFNLEGYLCNYPQSPNDKSTMKLIFLDKNNKELSSYERSQRNPQWILQSITAQKPKNAVKIRVKLIATRFVGIDNDGYFDNFKLTSSEGKLAGIYISGKSNISAGKSTTLVANNGKSTDPSLYTWTSSYDEWATVDRNGKVTLTESYDPAEGVTIYATDNATNIQGAFFFGNDVENEEPVAKVTGLKASTRKSTSITLKWNKSAGASKYTVYRYNDSTKKYVKVKTTSKTKLTVSKLSKGTEYKFKVIAEGKYGTETYTAPASKILKTKTK